MATASKRESVSLHEVDYLFSPVIWEDLVGAVENLPADGRITLAEAF